MNTTIVTTTANDKNASYGTVKSSIILRMQYYLLIKTGQQICIIRFITGNNNLNDVSQDKELNRRIGLAAMTFGKLKSMVFTSKKVSLRVKNMFIQPWFYLFFCMELQNHGPYPEPNCLG